MTKKASKPEEPEKPLFPLVFCRRCGTAYHRVSIHEDENGRKLFPREGIREEGDLDGEDAYLHISEESPWPRGDEGAILNRVPESFKEITAQGGERIRRNLRDNIPEAIFVDASGRMTSNGIDAALIHGNFLFCLEPSCGVAYTKSQRSERNKLATLGVDNRSTATTILAVRSLIQLQSNRDLSKEARKLLSFTDNRQDASLQAGHFNDFVQVALLRSALYRAASNSSQHGLRHSELSQSVFDAIELNFADYAADHDVRGPGRQDTHDALRRVIEYFLYRDLQQGWRVTAPNLVDCGLLRFKYEGLEGDDGLLEEADLWSIGFSTRKGRNDSQSVKTPPILQSASTEIRKEILLTLLDDIRRNLAIKVDALNPQNQHELVQQTKPRLREGSIWYLEDEKELTKSIVVYPRPRQQGDRHTRSISSYGAYGRYLKHALLPFTEDGQNLGRDEIDEIIQFLFLALKRYGIIEQVRGGRDQDDPGYQLNANALRWLPDDGEIRPEDRTRFLDMGEIPPEVNRYFSECYRNFVDLKCVLEAREHTAQVTAEDRKEREADFRNGYLPLLFCSPTMELGVDIAQLNLVNMRNVPPTPANYAQRSGRAGRGGQPALVFTYCAGRSPHDQYFYREPAKMVSGTVTPPRIDLRNRDLVRSHIHAIWLEVAKPDLGPTLTSVLELTHENGELSLPIKDNLLHELRNSTHRAAAHGRAIALTNSIKSELMSAGWFTEKWLNEVLDQMKRSFEAACDRWRSLYLAAIRQRDLHHKIVADHTRPQSERNHSKRLRAQAESQIHLLTEPERIFEGDFYSYRYFATEGFLPGYNFPRLPISAYVPGRRHRWGHDEYISRPRFLAISEFGPRTLVYHEGARYRVHKVNLDFSSDDIESTHNPPTITMKRCHECGYAHMESGNDNFAEICENCGDALDTPSRIDNLIVMQNVSLKLAHRITCDEEERQRFGYKLKTAYRFPDVNGQLDRKDAELVLEESVLAKLKYGDATDLYRINLGWLNQQGDHPPGFTLDLERGYWSSNQADEEDQDDAANPTRTKRVVPYVRDTKNALVMRFEPPLPSPEMAGLQAVFKRAIQQHFEIEPRELSCEPLPTRQDRQELLFYESSEGGAGVLRQLVEDSAVLPELARRSLKICHYDPDTLEDTARKTCGKACYECLLDYGNQPDHKDLDRSLIRNFLAEMAKGSCRLAGGTGSRSERLVALRALCDSKLEQRWLGDIESLGLRLPSDAQYNIPGYYAKPDFFYSDTNAAIFVDGPPHDTPDQIRKDEEITRGLMEMGYIVIRFHHEDDWSSIFSNHPDVFGATNT